MGGVAFEENLWDFLEVLVEGDGARLGVFHGPTVSGMSAVEGRGWITA